MADDLLGSDIGDDLGNLESLFDSSYVSIRNSFPLLESMHVKAKERVY